MLSRHATLRDVPLTAAEAHRLQQAFQLLQANQASQARQICQSLLLNRPGQADALHLLALIHKAEGDHAAAIEAFRASLRTRPHQPQLLNNLGNLLGDMGRFSDALAAYRQALALEPHFLDAWINFGVTADKAGASGDAIDALKRAIALNPSSAKAWASLGSAYRSASRLDDAVAALRKATALDPKNGRAWLNLGVALRLNGEPGEALPCFDTAERAGLRCPELADGRASALIDLGRTEDGLALYRNLTVQHPTYSPAHQALGKLLWEYNLADDPAASARQALAEHPKDFSLWLTLFRVLLAMERWDEALAAASEARRHVGDQPLLDLVEARVRDGRGERSAATPYFEKVIAALPDHAVARTEFARHLLRMKRPDAAAVQAERVTQLMPECQFGWTYLGTAWRLLGDSREDWLHDYDRLVRPLDIETPAGFGDSASFLAALEAALTPLHRGIQHPLEQSLRGGTQTEGALFVQKAPAIQAARQQVERAVLAYLLELPDDPNHPFLKRKTDRIRFTGSWSVRLRAEGFHVNHMHSEGWVSSAFYVHLPASVRQGEGESTEGWIQFGQPPLDLELDLSPRRLIQPQEGRLVLFPSYTWHGTVPFTDDETRLTIAFDAVPAR